MDARALAEREGKPIALRWIDAAIAELSRYERWLAGRGDGGAREIVESALALNFSLAASEAKDRIEYVANVLETYVRSREIIVRSSRFFVGVTEAAARRFFPEPHHADIPPAYAIWGEAVYFTPRFEPYDAGTGRGFGPLCRAAMVLHESVHVVDRESGDPEVHISEWDEPRFSAQTAEESLHNPSSYASFAAQVHEGARDWPRAARYGAGRRGD